MAKTRMTPSISNTLKFKEKYMVNRKLKKKVQKKRKITKPFNNYKILLHLFLLQPNQQTHRQNICGIDAHSLDKFSQKVLGLYCK